MLTHIVIHRFPPMCMGSRMADIVHKVAALLWMFFLDLGTSDLVRRWCLSTVSWTTDWGTESMLADIPNLSHAHICALFPGTLATAFEFDGE